MSESKEAGKRTATETLMEVMEAFGVSEPKHMAVVWLSEDGNVHCARDQNTSATLTLGMLEAGKLMFAGHFTRDDEP